MCVICIHVRCIDRVFLPALEKSKEDVVAITQCFLTHVTSPLPACSAAQLAFTSPSLPPSLQRSSFNVYMQYCKNKPTSDTARADHEMFFRQRQATLGQRLSIDDLLIAPVQRFTKYQLLLRVKLPS